LDDQLQLTGLKVIQGANGLFVAYPNDPGYKGEDFRSLFYPLTKDLRNHIESTIIKRYWELIDNNEVASWEVYDFLLKQEWLTSKERTYLSMARYYHLPVSPSSLDKEISNAQSDIKELRRKQRILKQGQREILQAKITARYGSQVPQMLNHVDKAQRALAHCIIKDIQI
jgi:DNA-binding cell septation regulator SpoVG